MEIIKNLGILYKEIEENEESLKYFFILLKLGKTHIDHAETLYYIGEVYLALKDYKKSYKYFSKAISFYEKEGITSYRDIVMRQFALTMLDKNNASHIGRLKKLVNESEKFYGKKHPDTAKSYYYLALSLIEMKDYSTAKIYLQKAIDLNIYYYGSNHYRLKNSYKILSIALSFLGEIALAEQYWALAVKIEKKFKTIKHRDTYRVVKAEERGEMVNCEDKTED